MPEKYSGFLNYFGLILKFHTVNVLKGFRAKGFETGRRRIFAANLDYFLFSDIAVITSFGGIIVFLIRNEIVSIAYLTNMAGDVGFGEIMLNRLQL